MFLNEELPVHRSVGQWCYAYGQGTSVIPRATNNEPGKEMRLPRYKYTIPRFFPLQTSRLYSGRRLCENSTKTIAGVCWEKELKPLILRFYIYTFEACSDYYTFLTSSISCTLYFPKSFTPPKILSIQILP